MTAPDRNVERLTARDALIFACTCALLAGLAQSAFVGLRVFIMHKFSWASRDIVWMSPLSYLLFLVPLTGAATLVRHLAPRRVTARAVIAVPLTVAGFGVLMLIRVIHPAAIFVLALGVSWQVAGWLLRRPAALSRLATRTAAVATVVVVLATAVVRGTAWRTEHRAMDEARARVPERPTSSSSFWTPFVRAACRCMVSRETMRRA